MPESIEERLMFLLALTAAFLIGVIIIAFWGGDKDDEDK